MLTKSDEHGPRDSDKNRSKELISLRPVSYERTDAPPEMLAAAEKYESKFRTRFESLTYFSKELLNGLHRVGGEITAVPSNVIIASRSDQTILDEMKLL